MYYGFQKVMIGFFKHSTIYCECKRWLTYMQCPGCRAECINVWVWKHSKSGNFNKVAKLEIQQNRKTGNSTKTGNWKLDLSQKQQNGDPMKLHCQEFRCPWKLEFKKLTVCPSGTLRHSTNLEWPFLYTHWRRLDQLKSNLLESPPQRLSEHSAGFLLIF